MVSVLALLLVLAVGFGAYKLIAAVVPVSQTDILPVSSAVPTTATTIKLPQLTPDQTSAIDAALTAPQAILIDLDRQLILYSKDPDTQCYPASITKLMTAAVALKYNAPDTVFTVGSEIMLVPKDASIAYIKVGWKLTMSELLDGMLLPSGADAAYVLAAQTVKALHPDEHLTDAQAVAAFVDLMNQTLSDIGAVNSHFTDPDGMPDINHYTTPSDLVKICEFALTFPEIKESCAKPVAHDQLVSGQAVTWRNSNAMLDSGGPQYDAMVTGLKTGSTDDAGYCLAATASGDGGNWLALVMGCPDSDSRFTDTHILFDAALTTVQ